MPSIKCRSGANETLTFSYHFLFLPSIAKPFPTIESNLRTNHETITVMTMTISGEAVKALPPMILRSSSSTASLYPQYIYLFIYLAIDKHQGLRNCINLCQSISDVVVPSNPFTFFLVASSRNPFLRFSLSLKHFGTA